LKEAFPCSLTESHKDEDDRIESEPFAEKLVKNGIYHLEKNIEDEP
jgi:hypothetical protein